jgi:hypothetical protein
MGKNPQIRYAATPERTPLFMFENLLDGSEHNGFNDTNNSSIDEVVTLDGSKKSWYYRT